MMYKINYKLLVVFLLIALQSSLFGATYYVSNTGSDANDGTINSPWATLDYGVANMDAGSTLYLRSGTYTTTVANTSVKSGLDNDNRTIIEKYPHDAEPAIVTGGYFYMNKHNYWEINGLNLVHTESTRQYHGVKVGNSEHWKISNCVMKYLDSSGILCRATVEDNTLYGAKNFEILNNDISFANHTGFEESLSVASATTGVIAYNKVYNNDNKKEGNYNCLLIDVKNGSSYIDIHHNEVYQEIWMSRSINTIGIYVDGIRTGLHHIDVHHNIVHTMGMGIKVASEAWGDGDDLLIADVKVYDNIIYDINTYAIQVGYGNVDFLAGANLQQRIYVFNNTIHNVFDVAGRAIYCNLWQKVPGAGGMTSEDIYFFNNIIWNSNISSLTVRNDEHNAVTVDTNVLSSPVETPGTNRISGDPLFANTANNDFTLQTGSSAINACKAGTQSPWYESTDDYDGNTRPGSTDNDIGAYEKERAASENKGFVIKEDGLFRSAG